MTKESEDTKFCRDCICWVNLTDADGGIGLCDSVVSEHNQHLVGYAHPACGRIITEKDAEDYEAYMAPGWREGRERAVAGKEESDG